MIATEQNMEYTHWPTREAVEALPWPRLYQDRETGVKSRLITDLAIARRKVTLNHAYRACPTQIKQGYTLFTEITISSPPITPLMERLMDPTHTEGDNDVVSIANAIAGVVKKRWDPTLFHIIMHSSGWDSRILSKTIANLRDAYGSGWLGDVLFLCWEPEGTVFKHIMKMEGWNANQYLVCNEGTPPGDYYDQPLDFHTCWKWTNDAVPPLWIGKCAINSLIASGCIPRPVAQLQYVGAGTGNECFRHSVSALLANSYYSALGASGSYLDFGERITPFASYDVLRLIRPYAGTIDRLARTYNDGMARHTLQGDILRFLRPMGRIVYRTLKLERQTLEMKMRRNLLRYLSPELLAVRTGIVDTPDAPHRQLSAQLRQRCYTSLHNSWYYHNVMRRDNLSPTPRRLWWEDWWIDYAKASICEHLVQNGVTIML